MDWYQTRSFIILVMISAFVSIPSLAADRIGMSANDMMKMEGLGAAAIDPSGRWMVYERIRPYDQFDDYSFRTYAFAKTGHQIWRYDLATGAAPILLPGIDPAPHSYLQEFSPSGRYLAIMQYRYGALHLGAYDMAEERTVSFSPTPAFSRDGQHNPIWISDSELMFATLPDGALPAETSVRTQTGSTLAGAWRDAWRGDVVTAKEIRTLARDQSDQQEPGQLVRADARTGRTKVVADGLYADLRVSSDRRYLAALSVSRPRPIDPTKPIEDDARRYRLVVFDLYTGGTRLVARDLEFFPYTIAWAPDGASVAAYGWRRGEGPRDGRFYVINVETGSVTRFEHKGLDLVSERERGWLQRPERVAFLGRRLAVFARSIPKNEDKAARFTYREYRPSDLPKPDWYALAADGNSENLTQDISGVSASVLSVGSNSLTVTAEDGVYRLYSDGSHRRLTPEIAGHFRYLSPGTFTTRSGVIRPEFGREALFNVRSEEATKIVMVDLREGHEGQSVLVEAPSTNAVPLAGSLKAGAVLFRAEEGPSSQLLVANADGRRAPREVARINASLEDIDLGTWMVVSYELTDPTGKKSPQTIESCVLLPPGYSKADPPPLIVDVYPDIGPSCKNGGPTFDLNTMSWSPYLWAGKGYAYARLTTPRQWIHTNEGPIAGLPAVIDDGVQALVDRGIVDGRRVALVGFSQGGISALYVAARSRRFSAVIAMNSWADLFSHYFGANGIYSYIYGEQFGSFVAYDAMAGSAFSIGRTPFEDPEVYYRNSPVFLAPQIDAPVLLIHSDMDGFSMSQFDEMYGALLRSGKDARYIRYLGEGHGPSSPANIRDLWERMGSFLIDNGVMVRKAEPQ